MQQQINMNDDNQQQITDTDQLTEETQINTSETLDEVVENEPTDDQQSVNTEVQAEAEVDAEDTQSAETTPEETTVTQTSVQGAAEESKGRWYVVHTYSGHENKVAAALRQKIESERLEDKILDILVPVQDKIEIKSGKKITIKEKIFPGYILVKMVLDDQSWLAVRTIQGVTSFVGIGNKPTPISEAEVQTIIKFTQTQEPVYKQVFLPNDTVKIVEGPFADFIGKIDTVDEEKGKVRVLVSIFGRETPVELDFLQVQKI